MIRALCLLCGARKETVEATCGECGHAFREDESELAHLFSSAHLSQEELEAASARMASGERPLSLTLSVSMSRDPGASRRELWVLLLACLLLTPLYGLVVAWGWRNSRPRACRHALVVALSTGTALMSLWAVAYWQLGL